MRILALCNFDVRNLSAASGVEGASARLFAELARSHELIFRDVRVNGIKRYVNLLRALLLAPQNWREFSQRSVWLYDERSRIAHQEVRKWAGSIDVIFQRQGLFDPFLGKPFKPYVIYTDYTRALRLRHTDNPPVFSKYPAEKDQWLARERQNYQNAARVFTYSDLVRRSMIADYGVNPERVVTTGVGVRLEPAPEDWVRSFDNNRIISIAHDSAFERKGIRNLLQAFELVRREITDAELILAGVSQDRDITHPGVQVLGFIRDRECIAELMESASVFAMTPLIEPFGQVFLEAMAKKLPCVGSAVDAIPEIIVDGDTGRLVPPEDPETLARTLIELLSDKDRLRVMGQRGYDRVRQFYTWDQVVTKINEHLEQVVLS